MMTSRENDLLLYLTASGNMLKCRFIDSPGFVPFRGPWDRSEPFQAFRESLGADQKDRGLTGPSHRFELFELQEQ